MGHGGPNKHKLLLHDLFSCKTYMYYPMHIYTFARSHVYI